jgi:hypothetical protein
MAGLEFLDFVWSTPWHLAGANLSFELNPTWVEIGQKNKDYINAFYNTYIGAILGWDLGQGFRASYTIGGFVPANTPVSSNFGTFEQRFALSYLAYGWNLTGRFTWGLPGSDENTGQKTAPDYLNFDLTATKKFGKWEAGLVGFASTDLNKPFVGYAEQSQVALGGLIAYDFGPLTIRVKGTRTIEEINYGGYDTRVWADVAVPLLTPAPSLKD